MAPMRLEIITAESEVYADDVDAVVVPGMEGQLGILPHHAPLMTMLQPGELTISKDGESTFLAVSAGFLEVLGNKVTILADAAERSEAIDEDRALAAMEAARERLANREGDIELEQFARAMRRAQVRLDVVRKRRPRADMRQRLD